MTEEQPLFVDALTLPALTLELVPPDVTVLPEVETVLPLLLLTTPVLLTPALAEVETLVVPELDAVPEEPLLLEDDVELVVRLTFVWVVTFVGAC